MESLGIWNTELLKMQNCIIIFIILIFYFAVKLFYLHYVSDTFLLIAAVSRFEFSYLIVFVLFMALRETAYAANFKHNIRVQLVRD